MRFQSQKRLALCHKSTLMQEVGNCAAKCCFSSHLDMIKRNSFSAFCPLLSYYFQKKVEAAWKHWTYKILRKFGTILKPFYQAPHYVTTPLRDILYVIFCTTNTPEWRSVVHSIHCPETLPTTFLQLVGRPWTCNNEELPKPRTFPCILAWPVAFICSHRLQEGTEYHELHLKIKLKVN